MKIKNLLDLNNQINPFLYISSLFFLGILFSGIYNSLAFIIIFFIIYGGISYILCRYFNVYWDVGLQLALFCAYFLGWLIGRTISGDQDPTKSIKTFREDYIDKWFK